MSSGHQQIVKPDGEPLRMPNGMPIQVSYSPSDWRTGRNEARNIRVALANLESQVREDTDE